jgi:hypothetical protein
MINPYFEKLGKSNACALIGLLTIFNPNYALEKNH